MARWKYDPCACNSKTSRRRRQRIETAPSGLCALTQRWRRRRSRVIFRGRPVLPVSLACNCLLLLLCIAATPVYTDPTQARIVKYFFLLVLCCNCCGCCCCWCCCRFYRCWCCWRCCCDFAFVVPVVALCYNSVARAMSRSS